MSTIIIAEAGVNHNGSLKLAKQMIDEAAKAGADYIKFQTFKPENLVSKYAQKADYQKKTTGSQESQLQMLEKLALSYDDFVELKKYCEQIGIGFLSTPFDEDSICRHMNPDNCALLKTFSIRRAVLDKVHANATKIFNKLWTS